jgi:multimeric flavodoxin WrbA
MMGWAGRTGRHRRKEAVVRIVAILGSPHGIKGNTGQLLAEVVRGAQGAGAMTTILSLADHDVGPCLACDACHRTGQCPQRDDFRQFKDAMTGADGIILASPNYIVSVSAQMKALMDRSCGLLHIQGLEGKYAAAVETSGGTGGEDVQQYLLKFLRAAGCWTVGSVGATGWQLAQEATRAKALAAAADLGGRLVEAITKKETFPDQAPERAEFAAMMKQLVLSQKDTWVYEYKYWQSRGQA